MNHLGALFLSLFVFTTAAIMNVWSDYPSRIDVIPARPANAESTMTMRGEPSLFPLRKRNRRTEKVPYQWQNHNPSPRENQQVQ